MKTTTVVGPLKTEAEALDTMRTLGAKNHSVYSRAIKDADGYDTDECTWFVERMDDVVGDTIFGYELKSFMARQYK